MSLQVLRRQIIAVESTTFPVAFPGAISSSQQAYSFLLSVFKTNEDDFNCYECFYAIGLDNSNHPIGYFKVSQGSENATVVSPRLLIRFALDCGAVALILCHNHPSTNLKPSQPDLDLTQKLQKAASLFEIEIHDHLIIGQTGYYSFADQGLLI